MRAVCTASLFVAASLLFAACGNDADSAESNSSSSTTTAGHKDDASNSGETETVEHAMGTTEVECTPQRIVTLGQGQTDTVLALGVTPVGVAEPWADDFYDYLPKEVNDAEIIGKETEPNIEAIAGLNPDVILGSKLRHEKIYPQLSKIAPTVFSETIGVAWKDNVELWSQALCLEDKGAEILTEYEEHADEVEDAVEEAYPDGLHASMVRFMPDQVRIYLTGFPGSVMRDAGIDRPKAQEVDDWDDSPQLIEISEERIPEMDGDVIFVMTSPRHYSGNPDEAVEETKNKWTANPLWTNLGAVNDDKVIDVNEAHWNLGGGIGSAHAMLDDLEKFVADGSLK